MKNMQKPSKTYVSQRFFEGQRWQNRIRPRSRLKVSIAREALPFEEYLERFGKEYDDPTERLSLISEPILNGNRMKSGRYAMRQRLFEQRRSQIEAQNGRGSWRAGYNELTDATYEELQQRMGYRKDMGHLT